MRAPDKPANYQPMAVKRQFFVKLLLTGKARRRGLPYSC